MGEDAGRGRVLYRDMLENNTPAMIAAHAAVRWAVGWSSEALRAADVLISGEGVGFSHEFNVNGAATASVIQSDGELHRHPDGVLFLTQFTQVAMATLAVAQVAEMRESGVFVEGAITCGHSVGEYNALAAVTGILPLEALL